MLNWKKKIYENSNWKEKKKHTTAMNKNISQTTTKIIIVDREVRQIDKNWIENGFLKWFARVWKYMHFCVESHRLKTEISVMRYAYKLSNLYREGQLIHINCYCCDHEKKSKAKIFVCIPTHFVGGVWYCAFSIAYRLNTAHTICYKSNDNNSEKKNTQIKNLAKTEQMQCAYTRPTVSVGM